MLMELVPPLIRLSRQLISRIATLSQRKELVLLFCMIIYCTQDVAAQESHSEQLLNFQTQNTYQIIHDWISRVFHTILLYRGNGEGSHHEVLHHIFKPGFWFVDGDAMTNFIKNLTNL
jgi:hypothetical protein